jgi:hypothetical protein
VAQGRDEGLGDVKVVEGDLVADPPLQVVQVDERQGVGEGSSKGQDKKPAIVGLGGAEQEGRLDDEDHSQEGEHSEEEMLEMERFLLYTLFTPYMGISKKWVTMGARLKRELAMLMGM